MLGQFMIMVRSQGGNNSLTETFHLTEEQLNIAQHTIFVKVRVQKKVACAKPQIVPCAQIM